MNILFTSVGRRVELIQAFREAAKKINLKLMIFGTDMTSTAPALFFCDKRIIICEIKDDNYIPSLLKICATENIDAVIPTIDTDLLILSENKNKFENIGTKVFVSPEKSIKICRDKVATASFFQEIGLYAPMPCVNFEKYSLGFPAFIKPKNGSSSINAYKINDFSELETFSKEVPDYIITPFISGKEYTVDVFCDYYGNPIYITPRLRLAVRAGEVLKTKIDLDDKIIEETKIILRNFKACGAITIQLIRQEKTNNDYFIEINPRFGGGAPLSMKAGANSALALLNILIGKAQCYLENVAENGAVFSRYDQSVRVR